MSWEVDTLFHELILNYIVAIVIMSWEMDTADKKLSQ